MSLPTIHLRASDDVYNAAGWVNHTYWYEVVRDGQQVTIGISTDGTNFAPAGSFTMPPTTGATQQIAIQQVQYNPAGSFTDWDWITVRALTDSDPAPIAHDDAYAIDEDRTLTQSPPGVLANDEGIGATSTAELATGSSHGSVVMNGDGSFTYTPVADYHGTDSFTYTLTTGVQVSEAATVTITVIDVNDEPTDITGPVIFDEQFSTSTLPPPWTFVQQFSGRGRYSLTDNPGFFRFYGEGSLTSDEWPWYPGWTDPWPSWTGSDYLFKTFEGDHWVLRSSATFHLRGYAPQSSGAQWSVLRIGFGEGNGPLFHICRIVDKWYNLNTLGVQLRTPRAGTR